MNENEVSTLIKIYLSVALKFTKKGDTKKALKTIETMKKVLKNEKRG